MTRDSGWTTTDSRTVYENPWISVREDTVVRPDGSDGVYGVVAMRHPAVFVVAVTEDDEVLLVELYRYPSAQWSLEVPAGGTDGQDPLVAAQRELLEETGWTAATWREVGRMAALNGVCDAPETVFLATDLTPPLERHATHTASEQQAEGITTVRRAPWPEVLNLIASGGITDGESIAALMFAAVALGRMAGSPPPVE